MKRKSIGLLITVLLIITAMMFAYLYPFAKSEPVNEPANQSAENQDGTTEANNNNNVIKVNSVEDLKKYSLLGTTTEKALEEDPNLGIAKEFCIFAENDVTFTGADTEGRIAAGGSVKATTGYEYQVGNKKSDEYTADIIVGNGPVENIALDFGYTDDGRTRIDGKNTIVAYASDAENMNLEAYDEDKASHFVEAELSDFESEFERLREYSRELNELSDTGYREYRQFGPNFYINYKGTGTNLGEISSYGIVLKGYNKSCNVFHIDSSSYLPRSTHLILDVPYDSKVIINDTSLNPTIGWLWEIYYPLSEEKTAEIDIDRHKVAYINYRNNDNASAANYIRDEENNIKPFIRIASGNANNGGTEDIAQKILYNIPNANSVTLGTLSGTLLAPNADINSKDGYVQGRVICKSYNGYTQFGCEESKKTRKYKVNINKIDETSKELLSGAELELLDEQGNSIHVWTSKNSTETVELEKGIYSIRENKTPENFENYEEKEFKFAINEYGGIIDANGNLICVADMAITKEYTDKEYTDSNCDWKVFDSIDCDINGYQGELEISWDSISPNVVNNEYNTSDGGKITVDCSTEDLLINSSETANNMGISYKIKNKTVLTTTARFPLTKRYSIIKHNSKGLVEWAANIQGYSKDFLINSIIEYNGSYVIAGGLGSFATYVSDLNETNYVAPNPGPPYFPIVIVIDKNGTINALKEFKYDDYGQYFEKCAIENGKVYCKSNNGVVECNIRPTEEVFPTTWSKLHIVLNNYENIITRVSFVIDTSDATSYTDKELNVIVAENNGKLGDEGSFNNWMEFVQYRPVADGEKIVSTVPLISSFYPYYNKYDNKNIIKFMPHFYRQISDTEAVEVNDIKIKDVKVYWKNVNYIPKQEITEVLVNNDELRMFNIPNKHITTSFIINKVSTDSNTPLKGAVFGIYNKGTDELVYTTEQTEDEGFVKFDLGLDIGEYYIKEITAPEGYELSDESKEFVVEGTGNVEVTFTNKIKETKKDDKQQENNKEPKEPQTDIIEKVKDVIKNDDKQETKEDETTQDEVKKAQGKKEEPKQVQT